MTDHRSGNTQAAPAEHARETHTETERIILARRSVRRYKKSQVPGWMVKRILEAGRFAPSAGNCQPWKFLVLRDREMIDELSADVRAVSARLARLLDYRGTGSPGKRLLAHLMIRLKPRDLHPTPFGAVRLIADGKLGLYHGAPTVIIILKDVRGISSPELDCGIAGQNMVLAAHSLGLGTCWVGFTKLAFQYTKKWKRRLGVAYPYAFANSIGIGFPLGEPDGMVPRPQHPVDWYEDGVCRTLWAEGADRELPASERRRIPDFGDKSQVSPGIVSVDGKACTGCGLCVRACPASSLELVDKTACMVPVEHNECILCGACIAICPVGAVTAVEPPHFSGRFKEIDRGELAPPRLFTGD